MVSKFNGGHEMINGPGLINWTCLLIFDFIVKLGAITVMLMKLCGKFRGGRVANYAH